jgi:hypothetical protein
MKFRSEWKEESLDSHNKLIKKRVEGRKEAGYGRDAHDWRDWR